MRRDHSTLRTRDLDAGRRFFEEVFDLRDGFRPPFDFLGHWLYAGIEPVVDLIQARPATPAPARNSEGIDHVAVLRDDHDAVRERLDRRAIPHSRMQLPEIGERRVFLRAPGGTLIEVAFRALPPTTRTQEVSP